MHGDKYQDYKNYSDESEDEGMVLRSTKNIRRRKSIHDKSPTPDILEVSSNEEPEDKSSSFLNESNTSQITEEKSFNNFLWLIAGIALIIIIYFILPTTNQKLETYDCSAILELEKIFPKQDKKIFKSIKVATEGLYNRNGHISVVSFFSTDQNILNDLTSQIVETTRICIKQKNDPINLTHQNLNQEKFLKDYTKIITEYKSELTKRNIMVINNLETLSMTILPSLHSFTDTYNPLVRKSIIYLTFKIPEKPRGKEVDYIHSYLNEKWKEMKSNVKGPLITRLLDQTFYLHPIH